MNDEFDDAEEPIELSDGYLKTYVNDPDDEVWSDGENVAESNDAPGHGFDEDFEEACDPDDQFLKNWDRNQKRVFRYLRLGIHELATLNTPEDNLATEILLTAFSVIAGTVVGFLVVLVTYSILWVLALGIGPISYMGLSVVPMIVLVAVSVVKDVMGGSNGTYFTGNSFRIGRSYNLLCGPTRVTILVFAFMFLGTLVGLLYFAPQNLFVEIDGGLWTCFVLATDNFVAGLLFDLCEIFDLSIGVKPENSFLSAATFLVYRLAFQGAMLTYFWMLFRMIRLHRIVNDENLRSDQPREFMDGLNRLLARHNEMPWQLFDDLIFFTICRNYLQGNFTAVYDLSTRFVSIEALNQLRRFFVDSNGNQVFVRDPAED